MNVKFINFLLKSNPFVVCPIYDEINVIQFFNQNSIFFGTLGVIIAFYIGFMGFHNMKITFWLLNSSVITLIFLVIFFFYLTIIYF